jgi:FkbM family methyltransferase
MTLSAPSVLSEIAWATPKRNSVRFHVRDDTNDSALVAGILGEDEYGLAALAPLSSWAIDIGAHIGIVALALAVDHPALRVVAVEAVPQNALLLDRNVRANGLADRVLVEAAGASAPGAETVAIQYGYTSVGVPGGDGPVIEQNYVDQSRFIGNIFDGYRATEQASFTEQVPALSLDAILAKHEIDRVALLKIDCEGCEYPFLSSPAVDRVDRILGEFHSGPERIVAMLRKTHRVTVRLNRGGVGIFDAVHR